VADEATILHADADSFYASVEQRDDPGLRGRPVIVGGGVVLAASYEAKAFGVYTPMGERQARRLCPQAVVVRPRMKAYSEASAAMFEVFRDTTPLVEGLSIDEAFLDVGGLRRIAGAPADIAARLRIDVRERVGIPVTVGVARTKFLAKVASGVAKPDGLLVVPVDAELSFLHALPVERLWGVGVVTGRKLRERSLTTVADIARLDQAALEGILGRAAGRHIHALAHKPRSPAGGGGQAPTFDRHTAGAGAAPTLARDARDRPARTRRPPGAAPAGGTSRRPDRDPPATLRRLLASDPLALTAGSHRRDVNAPGRRANSAERGDAHDP
jgi:DNA polymerase-4